MKKILVTGSSGHIGSEIYKLLKESDEYEVFPFDIKYASNQNILDIKEVANAVKWDGHSCTFSCYTSPS